MPIPAGGLKKTLSYLSSAEALRSLERDPYWPKWDSPWWHMLLLFELGLAEKIPAAAVEKMTEVLKGHYLPVFPVRPEEFPEGTDPYRKIACHCAVGSAYQLFFACGVDVDRELPWMRPWFLKYQLPDGGLNCDEAAYVKPVPKSSIVTTLPCLEAVLFCRGRALTGEETAFLDKGAAYLLAHKLFRKVSSGEVIDQDWLEVTFPRFYEYDFLRGYYFLAKWRQQSGFAIPEELTREVEELVSRQLTAEGIVLKRYYLISRRSYNPGPGGAWAMGEASEFDLMKENSYDGCLCPPLTDKWSEVKPWAAIVSEPYEAAYKNPIKLKAGEAVRIEKRETDPAWLGWVYCVDARGIASWVSEKYLKEAGQTAVVLRDYDAAELSAVAGEELKVYYKESGWCWSRNGNGAKGWIPAKNLKAS